jgi:hypothetical protein
LAGDAVFEEINRLAAGKRRQADVDDLGNETAGRETGRIMRFSAADTQHIQEEKRKREEAYESLLQQMLQNAAYAKLYYETGEMLQRAEITTDQALQKAELDWQNARDTLKETLKNANKLPDGTAVFKDAQGDVRTQDGRLLNAEERESIVWKQGSTVSYEEYLRQKQQEEALRLWLDKLRHYQAELGTARERWSDDNAPMKPDETKQMQEDIKRIQSEIETSPQAKQLNHQPDSAPSQEHEQHVSQIIAKPTI